MNLMICRSGAWVPPWCDQEFERLAIKQGLNPFQPQPVQQH